MNEHDVIVIGGGISGASFAFHAARAGRKVLLLEQSARLGGCLHSERTDDGYWYELGAHTCYNSYGAFLEVLEGCGLLGSLQPRAKPALRFLDGDRAVSGKNLFLLLKMFSKLELLAALPRWIGARQDGQTVRGYYSRLVGVKNYERVLGPMLSAVPSQNADAFPADMLFKKRARRDDVMRSYTLPGGLQSAVEAVAEHENVETRLDAAVDAIARDDDGVHLTLRSGEVLRARVLSIAVPPKACATLLRNVLPETARIAAGVQQEQVDSLGLAVPKDLVSLPYATFFIPLSDSFHSVVTRDVVPDDTWRGFTFHFRPGLTAEARKKRACEVLRVSPDQLVHVVERQTVLPSPQLGHADVVAALDETLPGDVAVTGNWFAGLSIEDCVLRSRAEWERVANG